MVKNIRPFLVSATIIICAISISGCGQASDVADTDAEATTPAASSNPAPASGPTEAEPSWEPGTRMTDAPNHAPPQQPCGGQLDLEAAQRLLDDGNATSVVTAVVSGTPRAVGGDENSQIAETPISDVQRVAGEYQNGGPTVLVTTGRPGDVAYPQGAYLLLLGASPEYGDGAYYVGAGSRGSFAIAGEQATQRCTWPNIPDKTTSMPVSELERLFSEGLQE